MRALIPAIILFISLLSYGFAGEEPSFPPSTSAQTQQAMRTYLKNGNAREAWDLMHQSPSAESRPSTFDVISLSQLYTQLGLYRKSRLVWLPVIENAKFDPWMELAFVSIAKVRALLDDQLAGKFITACQKRLAAEDISWLEKNTVLYTMLPLLNDIKRNEEAQKHYKTMNFPQKLYVAGPFGNRNNTGIKSVQGPEVNPAHLDPEAHWNSVGKNIKWETIPVPANGHVQLDSVYTSNRESVFYASLVLSSKEEQFPVTLSLNQSGASALWLNGVRIYHDDNYCIGSKGLQRLIPLTLRKGDNYILLKLAVDRTVKPGIKIRAIPLPFSGISTKNSAKAAIDKADKIAYEELRPVRFEKADTTANQKPSEVNGQDWGALKYFSSFTDPAKHPFEFLGMMSLLGSYGLDTSDHKICRPLSEKLVSSYSECPLFLEYSASCQFDENRKRLFIDKSISIDPKDVMAKLLLLQLNYKGGFYEKVLQKADTLSKEQPSPFISTILGNTALKQRWKDLAFFYFNAAAKNLPLDQKLTIKSVNTVNNRKQKKLLLERDYQKYFKASTVKALAYVEYQQGAFDKAAELYRKVLDQNVYQLSCWKSLADCYVALNQPAEAVAVAAEAVSWMPMSSRAREFYGKVLIRAGKKKTGVAELEQSLALYKDNSSLRDYLKLVTPGKELFYKSAQYEYADLPGLDSKPDEYPEYDALTILDQGYVEVSPNGTTRTMYRSVSKVLRRSAINKLNRLQVAFERDRQRVEIVHARVHQPDGSISEDSNVHEYEYGKRSGASQMYNSGMVKNLQLNQVSEGCIVDIQYLIEDTAPPKHHDEFSSMFFFGGVFPALTMDYRAVYPESLPLQHAQWGEKQQPIEIKDVKKGFKGLCWKVTDLSGIKIEPFLPPYQEIKPSLALTTFSSYDELGKWAWSLFEPQMKMPADMQEEVAKIYADAKTREDKIRAIYKFVTEEIRYVSISFGRFGYTPHKVERTFRSRYGDCKDTAILLCAILKQAGIDASPVLVRTRDLGIDKLDIPRPNSYNHAICYVPPEKEGGTHYWLDGTTDYFPLGMIPYMDRGTKALVFGPDGGKVLEIDPPLPDQRREENLFTVSMDDKLATAKMIYKNLRYGEEAISILQSLENEGQFKQGIQNYFKMRLPGAVVENMEPIRLPGNNAEAGFSLGLTSNGFVKKDNGSWKLPQILFPTGFNRITQTSTRNYPLFLGAPRKISYVTTYELPANIKITVKPEDGGIDCVGISYKRRITTEKQNGKLIIKISNEVVFIKPVIPQKDYQQLKSCFAKIDSEIKQVLEVQAVNEKTETKP